MVEFPFSGAWAVGTLVGVRLIFSDCELFGIGGTVRKGANAVAALLPGLEVNVGVTRFEEDREFGTEVDNTGTFYL